MGKGEFRWGTEAKLVCAISTAIVMMEEKKLDVIPSIARLLDGDISKLLRMWTRVTAILDIQLRPTSSLLVLEVLQSWIVDCLREPQDHPPILLNVFTQPNQSLESVFRIARAIDAFFQTHGGTSTDPAASTACAALTLAAESERGFPLQSSELTTLAKTLGARVGAYLTRTLDCRRAMMMVIESWATFIPWSPNFGRTEEERIWATPRKAAAIRVLSDVLRFQKELQEIRSAKGLDNLHAQTHPSPKSDESGLDSHPEWALSRSMKRAKGAQTAQRVIDQLLDPNSMTSTIPRSLTVSQDDVFERLCRIELQVLHGVDQPLTRLQALSLRRGGESNITDDELFEPGELDSYRNTAEIAQYLGSIHPEWFEESAAPVTPSRDIVGDEENVGTLRDAANHGSETIFPGAVGSPVNFVDDEDEDEFTLNRHSYMALGVLGDYEGSDVDTIRFFGANLES
ncbi:hypothetical protein FRC17_007463 [Serendipita sp. 399]|nr:hypothetical protein FRC17_007463 [Serendipita sp. 399]